MRAERRRNAALNWRVLGKVEQRQVLKTCVPNPSDIDFELLEALGAWEGLESEKLEVLVSDASRRRNSARVQSTLRSGPLPYGSIAHVRENVYCVTPAHAALQYSRGRPLGEVFMLLMELLGTYSMPEDCTLHIAWGGFWPYDLDGKAVEQARYKCDPAVTLKELRGLCKVATGNVSATFRRAVQLAAEGSASPGESVMFGMLGVPMRYGGFNLCGLPGGMRLNSRVVFDGNAVRMSSGMPYAICDAAVPAARVDLEYNGLGHEKEAARIHDGNRNNGLKGMGYTVMVINRDQMRDVVALEAIARAVYKGAGKRMRYWSGGVRVRQAAWLNALRRGIGLRPV